MKLMIEIEKEDFETIVSKYYTFPVEMKRWGINAIKSGIPLPENATNGDVLKIIFPEVKEHYIENGCVGITWKMIDDYIHWFRKDWWNAQYKVNMEESEDQE